LVVVLSFHPLLKISPSVLYLSKKHGDCYVPDRYKNDEGVCLGLWVRNQRRREDSLTADQHKRLSDLGLDWQTQNERFDNVWHERYVPSSTCRICPPFYETNEILAILGMKICKAYHLSSRTRVSVEVQFCLAVSSSVLN
jgi:Helicase associated domain